VWHDIDCSRCEFHFGIDTHGLLPVLDSHAGA
jgi:hypothetical protein